DIKLNGTDRETPWLQFRITQLLPLGNMTYLDESGHRSQVQVGRLLPRGVEYITVELDIDIGGGPFTFKYEVWDGDMNSTEAVVPVFSTCGGGYYVEELIHGAYIIMFEIEMINDHVHSGM
ncbi:hypothetical protein SARC_14431, partial [Sphaeroforma arctica JP610]